MGLNALINRGIIYCLTAQRTRLQWQPKYAAERVGAGDKLFLVFSYIQQAGRLFNDFPALEVRS